MATHVALLRGINVGGRNKVPMAELREVVTSLGHTGVTTYIQSGNVLFTAADASAAADASTAELAAALEVAIADRFGIWSSVVVLTRDELAKVLSDNPYSDEANPKMVHVVFLNSELPPDLLDRIKAAGDAAAAKGGRGSITVAAHALFLHTPDGFGDSELAKSLFRIISPPAKQKNAGLAATARNWATATKLLALATRSSQ
jgi:uncharacterized protein (DUF1697 family)